MRPEPRELPRRKTAARFAAGWERDALRGVLDDGVDEAEALGHVPRRERTRRQRDGQGVIVRRLGRMGDGGGSENGGDGRFEVV